MFTLFDTVGDRPMSSSIMQNLTNQVAAQDEKIKEFKKVILELTKKVDKIGKTNNEQDKAILNFTREQDKMVQHLSDEIEAHDAIAINLGSLVQNPTRGNEEQELVNLNLTKRLTDQDTKLSELQSTFGTLKNVF